MCRRVPGWILALAFMACTGEPPPDASGPPSDPEEELFWAAKDGDLQRVEQLLVSGVDASSAAGGAAVHFATRRGHVEMVQILLDHGADPDTRDESGRTPLMSAALLGHVDIVRSLLEAGADVHAQANDGSTAWKLASEAANVQVLGVLREVGARAKPP